jgi:hypothetical protein
MFQRTKFHRQSVGQLALCFQQMSVQHSSLRVSGTDGQRALETAFRADPIPFTQEHHGAERNLGVGG